MTGIILAGGKSSRMGQDKGLMTYKGKPLIRYAIDVLNGLVGDTIIISANQDYARFGMPVYSDIYPDSGPLGGIFTGLTHSPNYRNVVLGCDTPYVTAALLEHLFSFEGHDVVIPRHVGGTEQLMGVYSKSCLGVMERRIKNGQLKIKEAYEELDVREVNIDSSHSFYSAALFQNLNSPSDL